MAKNGGTEEEADEREKGVNYRSKSKDGSESKMQTYIPRRKMGQMLVDQVDLVTVS